MYNVWIISVLSLQEMISTDRGHACTHSVSVYVHYALLLWILKRQLLTVAGGQVHPGMQAPGTHWASVQRSSQV